MKPSSPQQLARLLDQIAGSYPNGIPISSIVSTASQNGSEVDGPLYQFIVVGEREISSTAAELLEGIASKGLRLLPGEYNLSYISESEIHEEVSRRPFSRVIVFGAPSNRGVLKRPGGEPALLTYSLEELLAKGEFKKELWRDLQTFIARS